MRAPDVDLRHRIQLLLSPDGEMDAAVGVPRGLLPVIGIRLVLKNPLAVVHRRTGARRSQTRHQLRFVRGVKAFVGHDVADFVGQRKRIVDR